MTQWDFWAVNDHLFYVVSIFLSWVFSSHMCASLELGLTLFEITFGLCIVLIWLRHFFCFCKPLKPKSHLAQLWSACNPVEPTPCHLIHPSLFNSGPKWTSLSLAKLVEQCGEFLYSGGVYSVHFQWWILYCGYIGSFGSWNYHFCLCYPFPISSLQKKKRGE